MTNVEEYKKLLDEQVELIKDSFDFYQANNWLSGFVACIFRIDTSIDAQCSQDILDYKSKLLWENFN